MYYDLTGKGGGVVVFIRLSQVLTKCYFFFSLFFPLMYLQNHVLFLVKALCFPLNILSAEALRRRLVKKFQCKNQRGEKKNMILPFKKGCLHYYIIISWKKQEEYVNTKRCLGKIIIINKDRNASFLLCRHD